MSDSVTFRYELGLKAKDKITGFEGTIDSRAEALNGCHRYYISPPVDKDGKLRDGGWFDEANLIVKEKKVEHTPKKTGGPWSRVK